MFNPIDAKRRFVQSQIEKSFNNDIEKARKAGDVHPNGKWVWTEYQPGKFDWRGIKKNQKSGSTTAQPSQSVAKPSPRDKIAQNNGFKDYDEMRGYQEYVTAKNLLKKPSTKGDARKEMETQVADYEKDHADVIKRIEAKNGKKKADKKSDDWNDNLSGYKTPPFEGAVKVADLKVGDKLVGNKGRTMTVIGVNKTKDGTDVGVKFDNPRIGDGTHWSVFNNNSYYGAKKADDKLSGIKVYYQTLAEKFNKTGKCESTDALIGVYKNNNPSKNIEAARALRKYIMKDLNYRDNSDWTKTLNEYKKQRLNADKAGDRDAYKAYDCAYQAVKDRIAKDAKNKDNV